MQETREAIANMNAVHARAAVRGPLGIAMVAAIALLGPLTVPSLASGDAQVSVNPRTDLASPATISVLGTGFAPQSPVRIYECAFGSYPCSPALGTVSTDGAGSFGPTSVSVANAFSSSPGGSAVSCSANTPCEVIAQDEGSPLKRWGSGTIYFGPEGPPVGIAPSGSSALRIDPALEPLGDQQAIMIWGQPSGYDAWQTPGRIYECEGSYLDKGAQACIPLAAFTPSGSAFGPITATVFRRFAPTLPPAPPVDCSTWTVVCSLVAQQDGPPAFLSSLTLFFKSNNCPISAPLGFRAKGKRRRARVTIIQLIGAYECRAGLTAVRRWLRTCVPLRGRECSVRRPNGISADPSFRCSITFPKRDEKGRLAGKDTIECATRDRSRFSISFELPFKRVPFARSFKGNDAKHKPDP